MTRMRRRRSVTRMMTRRSVTMKVTMKEFMTMSPTTLYPLKAKTTTFSAGGRRSPSWRSIERRKDEREVRAWCRTTPTITFRLKSWRRWMPRLRPAKILQTTACWPRRRRKSIDFCVAVFGSRNKSSTLECNLGKLSWSAIKTGPGPPGSSKAWPAAPANPRTEGHQSSPSRRSSTRSWWSSRDRCSPTGITTLRPSTPTRFGFFCKSDFQGISDEHAFRQLHEKDRAFQAKNRFTSRLGICPFEILGFEVNQQKGKQ